MAMPFLRAFTDQMLAFVRQNSVFGWDQPLPVPLSLKTEVLEIKDLLLHWNGRQFQGKVPVREFHSDSSNWAWGGVDPASGEHVQEFWRDKKGLHINVKELTAAISTVKSLARPHDRINLCVDNSVAFSYLKKGGGKLPHFNLLMRDFWRWAMDKKLFLEVTLVKSAEDLADGLSRTPFDWGDYTLHPPLFLHLSALLRPWIRPLVDMFASPGNRQLPQFCARHPHWEALCADALNCPLVDIKTCYANPPWSVILPWLERLRQNPHVTCMLVTPLWDSSPWWPLLVRMQQPGTPALVIPPFPGMFLNCFGEEMPPPKWCLLCTVLSGKFWKTDKYQLHRLINI